MNRPTGTRVATATILSLLLAGCVTLLPGAGTTAEVSAGADLVAARKAAGIAECPASTDEPAVAGGLPDLSLDCLGGGSPVRLAGLRGPMLVNLWAQWCEPCRAEAAILAGFAREQDEVAVLGVNYTDPQPALAIEFAGLTGMTFPHLADEEYVLKAPLGVVGIPYSLLVDEGGMVVARHPGPFPSSDDLEQWVAAGLAR